MPASLNVTKTYDPLTLEAKNKLFAAACYLDAKDKARLEKACEFARHAHWGQVRQSGKPYVTHPLNVAAEIALWGEDIITLMAAVLHDVLEDTKTSRAELKKMFGTEVTQVVDGVSKLEKLAGQDFLELQAESFRKLLLAVVHDLRVLVVKLADRLHNMRTLAVMRPDKQKRIAKETLEVYAELANRIGMIPVYHELQDLSFKYLEPHRYEVLARALAGWQAEGEELIASVLTDFKMQLVKFKIEARVAGNAKNLYAIFRKMRHEGLHFSQVMDMYGFVVLVRSAADCYRALGALHALYKPKPGTFKDYIAIPKNNGSQSLQTTLVSSQGLPVEVQIRTYDMASISEAGVLNVRLWRQDRLNSANSASLRTKQWFDNIKEFQEESDNALEFYEDVKKDLFPDELYVFTPKGKILVLPNKSTPIDFAYTVHTAIGHHCVGAKVNGNLVPLRHVLQSGDIIEIKTAPEAQPNASWLSFVVSARARSAIRSKLKNMTRQDAVSLGEKLLLKVLAELLPDDLIFSDRVKEVYIQELDKNKLTFEDVLAEVGMARISPIRVAMNIAELAGKYKGEEVRLSPIAVSGDSWGRINYAGCCYPIPGDPIRAVLVRDQGLVIHRTECPNLIKYQSENQLDAKWEDLRTNKKFKVKIKVEARDGQGLLAAVANSIAANQVNIALVETAAINENDAENAIEFIFGLEIPEGLTKLKQVIAALEQIPLVKKVIRK